MFPADPVFIGSQIDVGPVQIHRSREKIHRRHIQTDPVVLYGIVAYQHFVGRPAAVESHPVSTDTVGCVSLGVQIHQKHFLAGIAQTCAQIDAGSGLAYTALLVRYCNDFSHSTPL